MTICPGQDKTCKEAYSNIGFAEKQTNMYICIFLVVFIFTSIIQTFSRYICIYMGVSVNLGCALGVLI